MTTTIQIQNKTLGLLKKVKEETKSSSYDEAINKIVIKRLKEVSLAGFLGKRTKEWILKDLRDESDRI
ncbi:hypothetical protein HYX16_03745 [Candidatus Woesearchaeota archaeon]|nr:hypothetical protein [Candidatus Woesearchaeota archaeon]